MKFKPKFEDTRNFLKLKPSESVSGTFRGDPYDFKIHWNDNRSILCPGKEKCDLCIAGEKPKFRFRVNFIMKEGNDYVAKVIEQGWTFYETLRSLNESDYELEKYMMKITRQGSGMNTSYTIIPAPNGLLTSEVEKKVSQVVLNNIGHITEHENESSENTTDADIPF